MIVGSKFGVNSFCCTIKFYHSFESLKTWVRHFFLYTYFGKAKVDLMGFTNKHCISGLGLSSPICSWGGLKPSITLTDGSQITCLQQSDWFLSALVGERMALSEAPCLEMRKTAKPAIHERSVYNLPWPLTAKQCAAEHYGPLQGEERVITSSNSCLVCSSLFRGERT